MRRSVVIMFGAHRNHYRMMTASPSTSTNGLGNALLVRLSSVRPGQVAQNQQVRQQRSALPDRDHSRWATRELSEKYGGETTTQEPLDE